MDTTIRVQLSTKSYLDSLKLVPMESYDHVLVRVLCVGTSSPNLFVVGGTSKPSPMGDG